MRRSAVVSFLVVLAGLCLASPASAQLGSIKKKITEKAPVKPNVPGQPAATKPKCDNSMPVVDARLLDKYLKGIAARDSELVRLGKESGETGKYYAAFNRHRVMLRRRWAFEAHKGPDWERYKALKKRADANDSKALQDQDAIQREIRDDPPLPEVSWDAQKAGNDRLDQAMREGSGLSECDMPQANEKILRMVSTLTYQGGNPDQDLQGIATKDEVKAVRSRLDELATALDYQYLTPEDQARVAADKKQEEADKQQKEKAASEGSPMQQCLRKVQEKYAKQMEAAQKAQDNAAVMKLSQAMAPEMAKCSQPNSKKSSDDDDDDK
jgi:hypothetical protein